VPGLDRAPRVRVTAAWLWPVIAGAVALASWIVGEILGGRGIGSSQWDDAFITYRYAANLAEGRGFVFNEGERVLGTTAPLYALVLSAAARLTNPDALPVISVGVGVAAGVLAAWATYASLVRMGASLRAALLAASVWLFHPKTGGWVTCGLETPVVVLLMSVSFWALTARRFALAGAVAGLAFVARIDTAIWSVALVAGLIAMGAARALPRFAVGYGLIALPWVIFATSYFGSPVPNSLAAKSVIFPSAVIPRDGGLIDMLRWIAGGTLPAPQTAAIEVKAAVFIVVLALALIGTIRLFRIRWGLVIPIFAVTYAAAFWMGNAPQLGWYLVPLLWTTSVAVGLGADDLLARTTTLSRWQHRGVVAVMVVLAASLVGIGIQQNVAMRSARGSSEYVASMFLRAHGAPTDVLVAEAIGYTGFYSRMKVVDLAGLVTPEAVDVARSSERPSAVLVWALQTYRPAWVLLWAREIDENKYMNGGPTFVDALEKAGFVERYEEVGRFPASGPDSYVLFQLRSRTDGSLTGLPAS